MPGLENFENEIESRLDARRTALEEKELPALRQHFRKMQSGYQAIYNVLRKKGFLKEDPYKYEERLSELDTPSDAAYTESEKDKELSVRLGQYETRVAYLTDYYDIALDNLTLPNLKGLVKFLKYINWSSVSDNATKPTTRGLGEQLAKIKQSGDTLSNNIVTDAVDQLAQGSREAMATLKRVTTYQRERYKLDVRRSILSDPGIPSSPREAEFEKAVQAVKSVFARRMPGQPFARELILEIFSENDPVNGEAIRDALLSQLAVTEEKTEKPRKENDLMEILLDAARTLAGSSRALEQAVRKLSDNALVLESRKLSFGEMLRQVWDRMRGASQEERTFLVEYVDPQTNTSKVEHLKFDQFITATGRRSRVYNGLLAKSGPAWTKLQTSDEDGLLQFVTKDTQEMYEVIRRLESLDTFFKTEVPREQRSQLRSVGSEVTTINDHVARARKKTRQYVATSEERAQLRKLGITDV
jgi:hypothetical protein